MAYYIVSNDVRGKEKCWDAENAQANGGVNTMW
jgi:hypothetical protein